MEKKVTFFMFRNAGSRIDKFTVSRSYLLFTGVFIVACIISICIAAFHYHNSNIDLRENKIFAQMEEIKSQRGQVQIFANEINRLKSQLIHLNSFEKKIRVIANIENAIDQNSLFGVGGSAPDDLSPDISLEDKHNSLIREMHQQVDEIKKASVKQENKFQSLLSSLEDKRNLLASTPAIMPTDGWMSSSFGYRISPFTGRREFHKGQDIGARKGEPVLTSANGVVTHSGVKGSFGKVVVVDHGHGMVTRYAHLSQALKKKGDAVKRGDIIGKVGNTGRSTGTHLHYEVILNGVRVNPRKYIIN
jgi:murein DD-endopeptidase MepM/ murein hydrolase activator NlpD